MSSLAVGTADSSLVERLKAKNQEAFDQLYDQYAGALYGFICRVVPEASRAEALLQEVFIRIWRDMRNYNPEKERLLTWMFRLTLQVCGCSTETIKAINF